MAAPNLVNNTGNFKSFQQTVTLPVGQTTLVINPPASGQVFKIESVTISNVSNSDLTASTLAVKNGESFYIAKNEGVAKKSNIQSITRDTGIYLEEGDNLAVETAADSLLVATVTYEIMSNSAISHTKYNHTISATPTGTVTVGQQITYTVLTPLMLTGTVSYTISGVTSAQIDNASLTGNISITNGTGTLVVTTSGSSANTITVTFPTLRSSISRSIITGLYTFSTVNFTPAGQTGSTGPTVSQCLSSYNTALNPWLSNPAFFDVVTQGIQRWTVPLSGNYQITAAGAKSGDCTQTSKLGANGAVIQQTFALSIGDVLAVVVGQKSLDNTAGQGSTGGGGGSFVYRLSDNNLYIAAAGGGGQCGYSPNGLPAPAGSSAAGSNSNGGSAGGGGGGAGWGGPGTTSTQYGTMGQGGKSLAGNWVGGINVNPQYGATSGGFGGGGGGGWAYGGGGGGGGYQGGNGGPDPAPAGSAAYSYSAVTGYSVLSPNSGDGYVTITKV
jgi:hypothetical protein